MAPSVPVSRRAVLLRLKRALAPRGMVLRIPRPGSAQEAALGPCYVVGPGKRVRAIVSLEAFAREEGALAEHEAIE